MVDRVVRWTVGALLAAMLLPSLARGARPSRGDMGSFAGVDVDPPIDLRGRVVDRAGRPLAGASIEIIDFGADRRRGRLSTGADGRFAVAALARRSLLLRVARPGYYPEVVPVDLQRPTRTRAVDTGPLALTERGKGRARLMFVGDTMLGRRLVDDDGDGIEGEAGDLIRPTSRAADARRVLAFVGDALATADYTHANLECVVTDEPATPHPYKPYNLYTHPEALAGLLDAGIDGVSSGNNHVFDFLAPGVADTLDFIAAAGLDGSGAEMSESMARQTAIHATLGGVEVALQGLSEMRYDGADVPEYHLVAGDPAKPGALHASIANLSDFLAGADGSFTVPVIHGGDEYTRQPSDGMRALFVAAIRGGAGLVVAHHPHVLQGIGVVDGERAPRFVVMSLGNFVFDQDMAETIESAIAVVDVEATPDGEHRVARVELIPIVLDRYVPRLLAGEGLARLGRKLGHLSTTLPARDGLRGAVVFPAGHRVVALAEEHAYAIAEEDARVRLPVHGRATATTPYARARPADALARVRTDVPATLELGRDVLAVGDFEDVDVDGEVGEDPGWYLGTAALLQGRVVRRGARAAALRRAVSARETGALETRRRVPIASGARLTVRGHVRGHDAGALTVRAWFFSAANELLAERTLLSEPGGTHGWTRFAASVTAPEGASGMHLSFRQGPPQGPVGTVYLDDVAVIQWERTIARAEAGVAIETPNDWSYFRFVDLPFGVDTITATLTHRAYSLR